MQNVVHKTVFWSNAKKNNNTTPCKHCEEKRELYVVNMNFSFRFYIYKNLLLLHVQRRDFFFTIPWKSGMSLYICVWLCVNEISFALKGSVNVSLMKETRRLGQISSYQRISSLDVVRVKTQ